MGFESMSFDPPEGLNNKLHFPAKPVSEEEARRQIQGRLDELKDYINNKLISVLQSTANLSSGAESIGSAPIPGLEASEGVYPSTVQGQLLQLYQKLEDFITEGVTVSDLIEAGDIIGTMISNGQIGTNHIVAGAITNSLMAANSVGRTQLADDAVGSNEIADNAVIQAHLTNECVGNEELKSNSVSETKLQSNAVTASKIKDGNVTASKIADNAVIESKIKDGSITINKIASGAINDTKLAYGAVTPTKLGVIYTITLDDHDTTDRKDKLYYNPDSDQLKLLVDGCTAGVQLCPILYGTSATPPSGTYPRGTIYVQYEA